MAIKHCEHCGLGFKSAKRSRRFCSKSCSNLGQPRGNSIKRLDGTFYDRNSERIKSALRERYRDDPEFRARVLARVAARKAYPEPSPCESCGAERADRHHNDYSKPLDIRWLCRKCHIAEHAADLGTWGAGLSI